MKDTTQQTGKPFDKRQQQPGEGQSQGTRQQPLNPSQPGQTQKKDKLK